MLLRVVTVVVQLNTVRRLAAHKGAAHARLARCGATATDSSSSGATLALGRQRKFGAVISSPWGALDGAGPATALAMSAVPWIPVVGAAAAEEAQ
jgi:hypothetical protein